MAKHHPDLIMCRKQPGKSIGRLCEKDDGKCVICDSYVRPCALLQVCEECNYGSFQGCCVICGGVGILMPTIAKIVHNSRKTKTVVQKLSM